VSLTYHILELARKLPDASVDLIVTSPPFLALRSYLPADHPDKHKEIGSEPTPADFLDTLLALTGEWLRVLAPHGSICVELGDTYAGSGGAGGDYNPGGLREGQDKFKGSSYTARQDTKYAKVQRDDHAGGISNLHGKKQGGGTGWPLPKSLTGIPTLYTWSLAYGRNLLNGNPAPQLRVRNVIVWARPNPPVGALGDKFRPATSYITVACKGPKRYFDLDAVRTPGSPNTHARLAAGADPRPESGKKADNPNNNFGSMSVIETAGAPPLDWHADDHPEDGDWLWKMSTQPYSGKATTYRRVPCGPHDGGERTASPDCPKHGDLPGQVPKALRDERAASNRSRSPRISRNDDHLELTLELADAATDANPDHGDSSSVPMMATTDPRCSDAATPRSTASHRTDPAPATTQLDTPSARTARGIARTSTSPASSAPDPDTDASNTPSADSPASREPRTTSDIADIPRSERPCTCSFTKSIAESTSHYATFPLTPPKRLIEAMCPLKVCTVCGKPSERVVDAQSFADGVPSDGKTMGRSSRPESRTMDDVERTRATFSRTSTTLGWTDCGCSTDGTHWRTGVVLDPFAGSGTTLEAAQIVGRHAIGFDIDDRNADLARQRCGMFLEVVA
jgi:hypothetical protein